MPALYIQERANKGVCKPKADSEVRAIPPDGLHEFSLGQGCLKWEKLAGERCSPLRFSFSKKGTGRCGHRPLQIPLSATLTSQHKAHPSGAFSRGTRQLLCPVGHLLYKRRLFAWQTLYKNKNHAQNKHPECQHCTHRKRQTKAFASQRRTARNERIPPDGFRELCLGQYIPPALPGISSTEELASRRLD